MSAEQTWARVREARLLAETVLDWIVNPTRDAPPAAAADHLAGVLDDLERDLMSDLLAPTDSAGPIGGSEERRSAPNVSQRKGSRSSDEC